MLNYFVIFLLFSTSKKLVEFLIKKTNNFVTQNKNKNPKDLRKKQIKLNS